MQPVQVKRLLPSPAPHAPHAPRVPHTPRAAHAHNPMEKSRGRQLCCQQLTVASTYSFREKNRSLLSAKPRGIPSYCMFERFSQFLLHSWAYNHRPR
eukprot:4995689-Pleurochrysis_carterae.AAC.3